MGTVELWNGFGQELRAFIRRRTGNLDDADDLLQDVFVKIHSKIDTLRDEQRVAPWVYRITRNALIDYYRRRRTTVELPEQSQAANQPDDGQAEAEVAEYLGRLVDGLPDKYRQAVDLTEIQGLTQQQLAEREGLSLSGAKSRVQRSRRLLKQRLLDCCHYDFDRRGRVVSYTPRPECCTRCDCGPPST